MANFCIPKDLIDKLKPRMKEVGGAKLMSMSKQELTDFFAETLGSKSGEMVANSFRKASLSHKQDAMKQWAKKVLTPQEAKNVEKMANDMTEEDEVYEAIDGDVVEHALGITVSADEVDNINKLTEKMFEAGKKTPDNSFTGYHSDYFKAQKELNDYLDTINEMSNLQLLTNVIFRGNFLFSAKSILTNIVGNLSGGISEKIVNSILEKKATGVNSDLIMDYVNMAVKTYVETGIDVVRVMEATGASSVVGEHYQGVGKGKGALRMYGRFIEQYVLHYGQGVPDVVFASMHFADNVNILTTKLADAKGFTGDELKKEAKKLFEMVTSLRLDPDTPEHAEAIAIKQASVQYALTATYQNDTNWSRLAITARKYLDEYTGDLNLGTNLVPFVKTLTNIAKLSADMSGITLPFEGIKGVSQAWKEGDIRKLKGFFNVSIRAGLGMFLAYMIASGLDDDDYLPDYTIATDYQKEVAKLANAPYNSIRVGNKWVSLAYFGTLGWAIAGMLGARQKHTNGEKTMAYLTNSAMQLRQTPIVSELFDFYDYINDTKKYNKNFEDIRDEAIASTANFFNSRLIPAFVSDIAKATDDKERFTRYGYEGMQDNLQAKIPYWREMLPPKYNALGDTIPTESWYWVMLTGSRVKSAPTDTAVYNELVKLSVNGEEVKIKLDTYQDVKMAKQILNGREYNEFTGQLQKELTTAYANVMATPKYQQENDPEKKKKLLMDTREGVVKKVIRDNGLTTRVKALEKASKK